MSSSEKEAISVLIKKYDPNVDQEICDYVCSMLLIEENNNKEELLAETISQFLEIDNDSTKLVEELLELLNETNTKTMDDNKQDDETLRRLDEPWRATKTLTEELSKEEELPQDDLSPDSTKKKKKKQRVKKKREMRKQNNKKSTDDTTFVDDDISAWQECQKQGKSWGGRGHGGRGIRAVSNTIDNNIHLVNVTLTFAGRELLQSTTIDIRKGHRYGLLGRNGVGKSTLLQRLYQNAIPGMPKDMRTLLVKQQIKGSEEYSALDVLMQADTRRSWLLERQIELEDQMEQGNVETAAEELEHVMEELDLIQADTAEERARKILQGLQFTQDMIQGVSTENLSGGWRMRLALAQALFLPSDLLLLDECTNHLDLYGLEWLTNYLENNDDHTLIVVSHDRSFLDRVCTDIIVMEHQKLSHHVGSYSEYQRQVQEHAARQAQILDASERQRSKAKAFIQKQHTKSADPNKQRQAKMIKEKKLERIGNYREDGKKYKLRSLKKLSDEHLRLAQKVEIQADDPVIKMRFPNPTWPPGISASLVRLESVTFGYGNDNNNNDQRAASIIQNVTVNVSRGSKVAVVGRNGAGKSTLLKLIAGDLRLANSNGNYCKGELWSHPSLRIGHVTQYSVEELEAYAKKTVVEYAEEMLSGGKASSSVIASASGNVRQYLGAFGLGGEHAHRPIGTLSGGERMRLCFATVLSKEPHLLLLDESTNHVDIETLDSMSQALNTFQGAVIMVSHNQGFLSGFCKELWVVENGGLDVRYSDTGSFDEMFSKYRSDILSTSGSLQTRRREKATMAKKATQQRAGATQNVALL